MHTSYAMRISSSLAEGIFSSNWSWEWVHIPFWGKNGSSEMLELMHDAEMNTFLVYLWCCSLWVIIYPNRYMTNRFFSWKYHLAYFSNKHYISVLSNEYFGDFSTKLSISSVILEHVFMWTTLEDSYFTGVTWKQNWITSWLWINGVV